MPQKEPMPQNDFDKFLFNGMLDKAPMPEVAFKKLKKASASGDYSNAGTFRYIDAYKKGIKILNSSIPGVLPPINVEDRLVIALSDYRFTPAKVKKKTIHEMANELLKRGVRKA